MSSSFLFPEGPDSSKQATPPAQGAPSSTKEASPVKEGAAPQKGSGKKKEKAKKEGGGGGGDKKVEELPVHVGR